MRHYTDLQVKFSMVEVHWFTASNDYQTTNKNKIFNLYTWLPCMQINFTF